MMNWETYALSQKKKHMHLNHIFHEAIILACELAENSGVSSGQVDLETKGGTNWKVSFCQPAKPTTREVFCKDCRHIRPPQGTDAAPHWMGCCFKMAILSKVSGEMETRTRCDKVRAMGDKCGPEGKWFERGVAK